MHIVYIPLHNLYLLYKQQPEPGFWLETMRYFTSRQNQCTSTVRKSIFFIVYVYLYLHTVKYAQWYQRMHRGKVYYALVWSFMTGT